MVLPLTWRLQESYLGTRMDSYEEKLRRECAWYEQTTSRAGHFLNSRLFYSPERTAYNTHVCKTQFVRRIREVLQRHGLENPRLLIAPTGAGYDLPYLLPLSNRVAGIDISPAAIAALAGKGIETYTGDIKHMTVFEDNRFDLVIMSQFFHHVVKFGFDDFLREAYRVLRPGGHWFSFEPSILHPFCFAAWCGKRVFGNITGCVEDESPFCPVRLASALKRCGYIDVEVTAASYSHNRMPIPLGRIIHALSTPLLRAPLLKHFAWCCVFYARKAGNLGERIGDA